MKTGTKEVIKLYAQLVDALEGLDEAEACELFDQFTSPGGASDMRNGPQAQMLRPAVLGAVACMVAVATPIG